MQSNPLNRREMLAATAVVGTQLCLSRRLFAADDLDVLSFVIVSDTHLGRNNNLSAEKNWRKAIDEINQLPVDFVLHLGDVVDSGREAQYPVYVETRKLLKKPIHEIPGNHDPVDLFKKYVVEETDRSVDYGGVRFVFFNNAHRDSHDGFITGDQLVWLETQFAEATEKDLRIVVCCHVPIHTNKNPDRGWYVKPANGQNTFYELQARYADRILAIMHGHFHNGIRGWRDHGQTVETLCPSICYNQNRGLTERIAAGKATGFFVDELRPGYVLAELGKGKLTLLYKPLGADQHGVYAAEWS
ncbi:MAG: metallophosphoesterase [Planctomycetaceae bacterium]|nr:metallophosphoesterase [Planctomycetaceae bacterium]MDG2390068.1 metallophosphoesterase [Planctomycetaceae bacterium]